MPFNGNEGEVVTLEEASRWTSNFRESCGGDPNKIRAHFFGREKISRILNQDDAVGIRMYHGIDDDGKDVLILVGTDTNEQDLENGVIVERAYVCPPYCGSGSLNGL